MVGVAQLVRAAGCGPAGRGFKSRHSPHFFALILEVRSAYLLFLCLKVELSPQKPSFRQLPPGPVGIPSCPRAPPLLFVVALRSGLCLRSGAPCFARCVAQQVACSSLVTHPIFLPEFRALNSAQFDGFICQNLPIQTFWKIKHQTQHSKT